MVCTLVQNESKRFRFDFCHGSSSIHKSFMFVENVSVETFE